MYKKIKYNKCNKDRKFSYLYYIYYIYSEGIFTNDSTFSSLESIIEVQ